MSDAGFSEIADLALRRTGHAFRPAQAYLLEARLGKIIRREGFSQLSELAQCLKARPNPALESEVAGALTPKRTRFFRDRRTLERIVCDIVPDIAAKTAAPKIRMLCAGGGTGQEAYSIAILLKELGGDMLGGKSVDLVSVDLCKLSTVRGREGLFGHFEAQLGLSINRLLDNFSRRDDGSWQINDDLRRAVSFREHNLMDDVSGLGQFDIILCRQVLSHMTENIARDVAGRLGQQLAKDGVLFLGGDEEIATDDTYRLGPSRNVRGAYEMRDLEKDGDAAVA